MRNQLPRDLRWIIVIIENRAGFNWGYIFLNNFLNFHKFVWPLAPRDLTRSLTSTLSYAGYYLQFTPLNYQNPNKYYWFLSCWFFKEYIIKILIFYFSAGTLTLRNRGERVSLTFRKSLSESKCGCNFPTHCPAQKKLVSSSMDQVIHCEQNSAQKVANFRILEYFLSSAA